MWTDLERLRMTNCVYHSARWPAEFRLCSLLLSCSVKHTMTKAAIHLWMVEKMKTQRAFVLEQEQDKAMARGERIHLIWSQLAAHAYRNGQWGKGKCLPPLSFPLSLSLSLGVLPPGDTSRGLEALMAKRDI